MRVALLTIFMMLGAVGLGGEILRPSSLALNERIAFDWDHGGDRSGYRYVYEVTGGSPSVMKIFEYYAWGYGEDTRDAPLRKKPVGELTLKSEDAVGLDRLLEFYRMKRPRGSSIKDHVIVEYQRDGKTIGTEEFTDESGLVLTAEEARNYDHDVDEWVKRKAGGFDVEVLKALAPLYRFNRYLWKKEANQSLQPLQASGPRG